MNKVELILLAKTNPDIPEKFCTWLDENEHIWDAFREETFNVIGAGFTHYSANAIVYFLRHYSAVRENGGQYKINSVHAPYLARLFAMVYPKYEDLFQFKTVTIASAERAEMAI